MSDELIPVVETTEDDDHKVTITTWFKNGEQIRQDVSVTAKRGIPTGVELGR